MTVDERTSLIAPPSAQPKLQIERRSDGAVTCLRLAGAIDEQFDGGGLAATVPPGFLLLDLGGIERISSFGIRQWMEFINACATRVQGVFYAECAPKMVDQFNMVANFGGSGYIVSFFAPYRCEGCDSERRRLLRTDEETPVWRAGQAPSFSCPTCGRPEDFDEDPAAYFAAVAAQPRMTLPAPVATFLRTHLNYGQGGQRKLRIEKRVEGRTTLVRLLGDLDSDLRAQKLAEGLEGEVVFDLAGVLSVDPVGAAQWRKMMQVLAQPTAGVERIHLTALPPLFLERLGRPEDLTALGQVLSVLVPYHCNRCRATTQRLTDFVNHHLELRAGRVPKHLCPLCNGPVLCIATETWRQRIAALPTPHLSAMERQSIQHLLATSPAPRPQTGTGTVPPGVLSSMAPGTAGGPSPVVPGAFVSTMGFLPPTPYAPIGSGVAQGLMPGGAPMVQSLAAGGSAALPASHFAAGGYAVGGTGVAHASDGARRADPQTREMPQVGRLQWIWQVPGLVPGLLVVALAVSMAVVFRILSPPEQRGRDAQVVDASQPKPPPWHEPPAAGGTEVDIVGRSSLQPDRQAAVAHAEAAATAELARRLGEQLALRNPAWPRVGVPLYAPVLEGLQRELQAAGREGEGAPRLAQARLRLSEAQKRVAAALQAGGGLPPLTVYWEKLVQGEHGGPQAALFRASARYAADSVALERLLERYQEDVIVMGVQALSYFPMLSWRYELSGGALIIDTDAQSPLSELRGGDVVVSVGDREIKDAAGLRQALEQGAGRSMKVMRGDRLMLVSLPARALGKGRVP